MLFQFNRDNQITQDEARPDQVEEIVRGRLDRILKQITRVEVHVGHVKESRTNQHELRCSIEVRPENMGPVAAAAEGVGLEAVVRSASDKVLHAFDKAVGKKAARAGH
jgi:hypothetical protein